MAGEIRVHGSRLRTLLRTNRRRGSADGCLQASPSHYGTIHLQTKYRPELRELAESRSFRDPDGYVFEEIAEEPKITVAVAISALESVSKRNEAEMPLTGDPRIYEAIKEVPVEVVAELGRIKVGLRELLTWHTGQVLRLSTAIDDPILLRVAGMTKFSGRPVISRGQLSIEIKGRAED